MDILFRRCRPGNRIDTLIAAVTGGEFCHCEVRFDSGACFSSEYGKGVRWASINVTEFLGNGKLLWEVVPVMRIESQPIIDWCSEQVGKQYDTAGAIAAGLGLDLEETEKWFCSEIVAAVLLRCGAVGVPTLAPPSGMRHREGLYEWIQRTLKG